MIDCVLCSDTANIFIAKSDGTGLLGLCSRCVNRMAFALRVHAELQPILERDRIERLN